MSCNCHEEPRTNLNTWGCGCNKMPEEPRKKGVVKFCDICDPCAEGVTNVKICAFVVPTLEEGRYYKNSFIFVQEDDSVYFISDDRSEIPFGSRPKYIENFDPEDSANKFKNTTVYDMVGMAAYVYGPDGTYLTIPLTATPIASISGGEGIVVTATGGDYTVAANWNETAKKSDLDNVTALSTNHTGQITNLQDAQDTMAGDIETIQDDLAHTHDLIDDANELAVEAKENATAAQQTANDALSAVATKQDALTPGTNITIANNVISATDTTYERATATANGLMGSKDREALVNDGLTTLGSVSTDASEVEIGYSVNKSSADGSSYSSTNGTVTLPAATTSNAGVMTAADKTKLDNIDVTALLSSIADLQNRVSALEGN